MRTPVRFLAPGNHTAASADRAGAEGLSRFRVWPDGTVQCVEGGEAYAWLSDDYMLVEARCEGEALQTALLRETKITSPGQGANG